MNDSTTAGPARALDRICARAFAWAATIRLGDRGDVPGWVLVSVMTAGLTTAVWLIADDQLTGILDRAMSAVSQP